MIFFYFLYLHIITMDKILGLNLGVNSIGWAIIGNRSSKIIEHGDIIIPSSLNYGRYLRRKQRREENRLIQRILRLPHKSISKTRIDSSILILTFCSFLSGFLTIFNFSNWQFWFNSFWTTIIAILTITNKK